MSELRDLIREEYLTGVPEFALRQATKKYVDEVRRQIFKSILASKSHNAVDQRAAIATANQVVDELEEKVNELMDEQLWNFLQRT